jgi:hypothetical protein
MLLYNTVLSPRYKVKRADASTSRKSISGTPMSRDTGQNIPLRAPTSGHPVDRRGIEGGERSIVGSVVRQDAAC